MEGNKGGEFMQAERQNNQLVLAFGKRSEGEARSETCEGIEVCVARADTDSPAAGPTMEEVLEPGNLKKALERVRRNKGALGVDGMTVEDLGDYLRGQWSGIRARLLEGSYSPRPVRRVEIPKAGGGMRLLGVPTVLDRFIQQAVEGVGGFLAKRLKLVVNTTKSAVGRPARRSFLGFSFTPGPRPKRRVGPKALGRFKQRVRELTRCVKGVSLSGLIKELSRYIAGWRGYFGRCETPGVLRGLDKWIRRRIRAIVWRQWKMGRTRFRALRRLGIGKDLAAQTAGSSRGPWSISASPALSIALPNAALAKLGLASCCPIQ